MRSLLAAFILFFVAAVGSFAPSGPARAQSFMPPIPENYDDVDVFLLTVGRGELIHSLFGHTFLRVVDKKRHLDMNFNWGMFDFQDPAFLWKFYRGDLNYYLEASDFYSLIAAYRNIEHRRVTQERVNLTAKQKETLIKRLRWNSEPDHVHYAYSQVWNNCSTKPRDYLDEALGGKIQAIYGRRPGRTGFRPFIRDGARQFWWADIGLDSLLNSTYDRPISNWEEMFLPAKLREHLLAMPAYDDVGHIVPGKNLLSESQAIVDLPEPPAPRDPYFTLGVILTAPLALLWLLLAERYPRATFLRLLGLYAVGFGLWSFVWGAQFVFQWSFALYFETKRNALLWIFWPIDFIFAAWGLRLLVKGALPPPGSRWNKWIKRLSWTHLFTTAALVLLWATLRVQQDVAAPLATSGMAGALFYGLVLRRGAPKEA